MRRERADRRRVGPVTWLAIGWMVLIVAVAVLAPVLPIRDPDDLGIRTEEVEKYEGPGVNAWFGGDGQGRDVFSNMVWGARLSLLLGFVVTSLSLLLGGLLGVVAGYRRGRLDRAIMTITDMALAFPALILLVALGGTLGRQFWVLVLGFTVLGIAPYARVVRGATLSLADREFVEAARAMGASRWRIVSRELLPNIAIPTIAYAFLGFAIVIASEGALAFIGLSVRETTWGVLIAEGARVIDEAAHLALIPAAAMFSTILALNLIGDRLRQMTDVRPVAAIRPAPAVGPEQNETGPAGDPAPTDTDQPSRADTLLRIVDLRTRLHTRDGVVTAVDGVSLHVGAGESLGIVGESGSGKTMILRSILGTFPVADVDRTGTVEFDGSSLLDATPDELRRVLGTEIGLVPQNPLTAFSPVRTVGSQLIEPMTVHGGLSRRAAKTRALELLRAVGIPEPDRRYAQYPHEMSGGMRQRVAIAAALANEPRLLLADEPTTALDVTVQGQILELLADLQRRHNLGLVLVTHDLAVIGDRTDRLAVVYAGQVVETGPTRAVFDNPRMRYTQALLDSTPRFDHDVRTDLAVIDGQPPSLLAPPSGCRFAPRCGWAEERCRVERPRMEGEAGGHRHACWFPAEGADADRVEEPSLGR